MPLYVLHCPTCDKRFERLMRISDKLEDETCISCEKPGLQKVLTSISNYSIQGNNSASTKPRSTGNMGKGVK